jgi:hypothetical protein
MRASPVVNPRLKRIAEVLADLQGPMGQIIPGTDFNPFQVLMPQASTFENLAYGNSPFSEYSGVTNRRLPIVKTGREGELTDIADVALMASGVPAVSRGVARGANYLGDVMTQAVTRNPQATSMRALNEISQMSPFPQVAPQRSAPTPVKSDLGFYSQLEAATLPLQNKGTGQQYLAQIAKTPGVKPEELQWTGLSEFLENKPSVTRDEILNYLNTNRVDVQEVRLGENGPYTQWKQNLAQAQQSQEAAKVNMELTLPDNFADINYYNIRDMWAAPAAKGDPTALGKIRFLGLSPEQEANILDYGRQVNRVIELKKSQPTNTSTKFSQYTLPGGENYREILLTLPAKRATEAEAKAVVGEARWNLMTPEQRQEFMSYPTDSSKQNQFKSTHFDQPNILAHMRVNDRVVDGKKTLFIEEIQSDWHQAGRKKGYGPQTETTVEAYYETKSGQRIPIGFGETKAEAEASIDVGWKDTVDVKYETIERKVSEGVPDAPFKTSWHELSLKRAIQEASEKGYDQIAFTTGKTQAERYDLSQQIDEINVVGRTDALTGEQTKSVALDTTGGQSLRFGINKDGIVDNVSDSNMSNFVGKGLDEVIGKDLAKKIMDGGSQTISGEGLKVGGEGMKGFYDNILPKSLDKLAKKFDAKVGKTFIEGERTRDASGIPSMYPEKIEVWSMDITPKMRESVTTKGQPLFAVPAIGAGLLGAGMMEEDPMAQFLNYQ